MAGPRLPESPHLVRRRITRGGYGKPRSPRQARGPKRLERGGASGYTRGTHEQFRASFTAGRGAPPGDGDAR